MHRTQVLLEDRQYAFLKKLSQQQNKSMSQVLREIIDSYSSRSGTYSLSLLAGILEDPGSDGRDHDRWIYEKE